MNADDQSRRPSCAARAASRDGDVREIIDDEVRKVAPLRVPDDQRRLAERAIARLSGLGELEILLADPSIDEIMVNSDCDVWVDRHGSLTQVGQLDDQRVEHLIERILAPIGRRVDRTSPIVDARLADGSRVCAVLPPVAVDGAVLSIRRFASDVRPLTDFVDARRTALDLCQEIIECPLQRDRVRRHVVGQDLAARRARSSRSPPSERLVVIEDTAELAGSWPNVVRLEARPALADGPPPVELSELVRTALRLRPDRIVVGEVRGDEVLALVQAMNTGHDGSISTCHSNGPLDTLLRLESLVLQAAPSWPLAAIRHHIQRSIDVVIHVASTTDGRPARHRRDRRGHRVPGTATDDTADAGIALARRRLRHASRTPCRLASAGAGMIGLAAALGDAPATCRELRTGDRRRMVRRHRRRVRPSSRPVCARGGGRMVRRPRPPTCAPGSSLRSALRESSTTDPPLHVSIEPIRHALDRGRDGGRRRSRAPHARGNRMRGLDHLALACSVIAVARIDRWPGRRRRSIASRRRSGSAQSTATIERRRRRRHGCRRTC